MKGQKLVIIGIMTAVLTITGCNTFKGMGKDLEEAGKAIGKAADKTKEDISK